MLKRLLELLKLKQPKQSSSRQSRLVDNIHTIEHKTFTDTLEFIKAAQFEQIWVAVYVNINLFAFKTLNDDEYLDYKIWEDMNRKSMYKKYLPDTILFIGKNPNIIFHGGCLGCLSQRLHGFERCRSCQYFRANWDKPNLHIEGEDAATIWG